MININYDNQKSLTIPKRFFPAYLYTRLNVIKSKFKKEIKRHIRFQNHNSLNLKTAHMKRSQL